MIFGRFRFAVLLAARTLLLVMLASPAFVPDLWGAQNEPAEEIALTILPLRFFVDEIDAALPPPRVLVEPGASPHTWEPSAKQIAALADARLLLAMGMPFENALVERLRGVAPGLKIVDVGAAIEREGHGSRTAPASREAEHAHGTLDPHVWLSPVLAQQIARATAEALTELYPERREQYLSAATFLGEKLQRLHEELAERLETVRGGSILVLHPAYGYFCREYGLHQVAIQPGGSEPGSRELVRLIDFGREHAVGAILVQPQFSARSAQKVGQAIGARLIEIDPLSANLIELYSRLADLVLDYAVSGVPAWSETP